jgi:putative transcriptional regulator
VGKLGKELIESMQLGGKACRWQEVRGLRVSKVELPDVKAIRLSTGGSESDAR